MLFDINYNRELHYSRMLCRFEKITLFLCMNFRLISLIILEEHAISCMPWSSRIVSEMISQTICVVVIMLFFYVHGKHLRSCQDGQLT